MQYEQQLLLAGLTKDEAKAYEALVRYGSLQAADVAKKGGLSSRTLAYKVLDQLAVKGLVEKRDEPGKVASFFPAHPLKLKDFVERERERTVMSMAAVEGVLGKLTSDFNLISGKPGVRFFEGKDAVKAIREDSLAARHSIDTYVDLEMMEKYFAGINKEYALQRSKFNITKRGIVLDSPFNRSYVKDYYTNVTTTKFLKAPAGSFPTIMQMYDNKVTYLTMREQLITGVIVEDPQITQLHRTVFGFLWETLA